MQQKKLNKDELEQMQLEAMQKVQEMQSRAKKNVDDSRKPPTTKKVINKTSTKNKNSTNINEEALEQPIEKKSIENHSPLEGISDVFDSLMEDSERTIILILILILINEEADMGLVLSLMYLII